MTKKPRKEKIVGILGGMGPEATVELMRRVIDLTPANDDSDHIRMLVDNNPKVPSRLKALIDGNVESPLPVLTDMAQGLEKSGADFLVMPCNTAHYYFTDIANSISIPFINLIELTTTHIKKEIPSIKSVGVLASTAVKNIQLYNNAFEKLGVSAIFPEKNTQDDLMQLIKNVKSKSVTSDSLKCFSESANELQENGAECLIIACTELSVIAEELTPSLPVFDAMEILAQEIVNSST